MGLKSPFVVRDARTGIEMHFKSRVAAVGAARSFARVNPWARPDLPPDHPEQKPRWQVKP